MPLTLAEYQPLAARTAAMDVPHAIRQATFALGLVCEATEVLELFEGKLSPDADKLTKELGDVLWYAAGLCTLHDMSLERVVQADLGPEFNYYTPDSARWAQHLAIKSGEVSDYMKKVLGHGHPLDKQRLADGIRVVMRKLHGLCLSQDLDLANVAQANVDKLKARYPEGFSTEASINRTS